MNKIITGITALAVFTVLVGCTEKETPVADAAQTVKNQTNTPDEATANDAKKAAEEAKMQAEAAADEAERKAKEAAAKAEKAAKETKEGASKLLNSFKN